MNNRGEKVALSVGSWALRGIFGALRYTLYVALLLVGRVFRPMAGVASAFGLFVFLFCLILRRDLVLPMFGGLGLAIAGGAVLLVYDAALSLVAPERTVIIIER